MMPKFLSFAYLSPGEDWPRSYSVSGSNDHALRADGLDSDSTLLNKLCSGSLPEASVSVSHL